MTPVNPVYHPDPDSSREAMEAQQRELASEAVFADDGCPDPAAIEVTEPLDLERQGSPSEEGPIVAGVDQAFEDDMAVSAVVAVQNGQIVETVCARTPLSIPYIPGLLAFREGEPIVEALASLAVEPDLLVFDGSGRIHYREAGIATHVGVLYDVPALGVTKNLLCGTPDRSLEEPLPEGTVVPIRADDEVETDSGTVIGQAVQTRQFPNPEKRHVNPVYVSPGHRVVPDTAVDLVPALGAGYKLPEPIRLADRAAGECKR
ncbi:MAG: endonuclease V [Halodesulfurarchaeum sp.]|nr:endonuclease V [Halodesulfurarchaeum sp.]